jgi:hypothetical protein
MTDERRDHARPHDILGRLLDEDCENRRSLLTRRGKKRRALSGSPSRPN